MADLPTGTVTFLFTDIEGSTSLWEQHPEAMKSALASHDALLRHTIRSNGGYVFKTMGDAFYAVFPGAADAISAALAAQRGLFNQSWDQIGRLRVRMALHTGTAEERDGDYFGPALNRVARLLTAGHGGQMLLSLSTKETIGEGLPSRAELRDLGERRLKDLSRPERIYQLVTPDLPADFPPLKTLEAVLNNLPTPLTSFIGREREIAEVKRLLSASHLLTLTGSGGCGKTRLSLQVAADLLDTFAGGVWFVELASLSDPPLVPQAVATAIGVREEPGSPILATLVDHLRGKTALLILDNCEHLVRSCTELTETLLRACPNLRMMASSREAFGIVGETVWRVPSLALPDWRHLPPVESLVEFEAVRLFYDRARAVAPRFSITGQNAPAVAQVCYRLDGIPLAIELAAARVNVLSVEQIAARLDDRFRLLTGGSRTALPRQRTLRAAIDWSYDLLAEAERLALRRVSIFAGGFTLDAAEVVCAGEGAKTDEVLDLLSRLVEKSLVIAEEQGREVRYRLLEIVRQYSGDRLVESQEAGTMRRRHQEYFLGLAERAGLEFDRLELEHDNLRGALAWGQADEQAAEAGLSLAVALARFWLARGYFAEGREWLTQAMARASGLRGTVIWARALGGGASLAASQGDYAAARSLFEESLAIRRELGDRAGIAASLQNLGAVASTQRDSGSARSLLEESLAIWRELGDKRGMAFSLVNLGGVALDQGDYASAQPLFEESLAIARELNDQRAVAMSLNNLGVVSWARGDYATASAFYRESLSIQRELGDKAGVVNPLNNLGVVAWIEGDYVAARSLLEESLAIGQELGNKGSIAESLEGFAGLSAAQGQSARAACLYGAAGALREAIGAPLPLSDCEFHDRSVAAVRRVLGEKTFQARWNKGRAMSLEQAMLHALTSGEDRA